MPRKGESLTGGEPALSEAEFVTKPFHFQELLARLHAVLRSRGGAGAPPTPVLRLGNLELELESRTLRKAGREIHLSPKEFELLAFLMQHKDVPVTHAKVLRTIWGPDYADEPDYLRSYVKMLRKKIEDDPAQPEYILTEPWVGYRFRDPDDPETALPLSGRDDDPTSEFGPGPEGQTKFRDFSSPS